MTNLRFDLPTGMQYGTILADPPWPVHSDPNKQYPMTHRMFYERMPLDEIKSIPVGDICDPDAHLWLWTTNPALEMALEVVHAWGFEYKTLVTWRKSKMGLGWWLRSRTEHLILAAKSKEKRVQPGSWTTELVGKWRGPHIKPHEQYDMIEALSPGPRIELFHRQNGDRHREGWDYLGADMPAAEAYGQSRVHKPGTPNTQETAHPSNGAVRGIGGMEIVKGRTYYYLETVLIPTRVKILGQTNRKVKVQFPDDQVKSVSVDNLRNLRWKQERSGQRTVLWPEG